MEFLYLRSSSPAQGLEQQLHSVVSFGIMPLFAFANTSLVIKPAAVRRLLSPLGSGILAGLVLGKPVGIGALSWLTVRLGEATLPPGISWRQLWGAGMLGGIGFTMSIFVTLLAVGEHSVSTDVAKLAILLASLTAGARGGMGCCAPHPPRRWPSAGRGARPWAANPVLCAPASVSAWLGFLPGFCLLPRILLHPVRVVPGLFTFMLEDTKHYFSNAVGSVLYVPGSFVYLHWTGEPVSSTELRALYVHARNLLLRYNLRRILADHRAMPAAFEAADRTWLLTDWFPHTTEEVPRVRYAALPSSDPQRRLHTDDVVQALRRYAQVALFDDIAAATAWLEAG
ncbi:Na+/H+ antiporter NhaA [Hymenobacter swuensis]|uniref:Uncharacterized protein n=1 Tax=Hymenobacter swuensis DY53 TaxID=1227739 RepID=W8EUU4_9BACT|nr:Na+/H+ antiporter NhaA [Hymenobacter swuensis]AHJ95507.1 hypothetical protein Hsw_PA0174 [Hymenobacter swuensis DY53]